MVTEINDIIKKDTGWHLPNNITQWTDYGNVNQTTCYAYSNLDYLKKRDNTCASIAGDGGVNATHGSPVLHCSNFKFNIPDNAIITKITVRQRRKCNTKQQSTKEAIIDRVIRLKIGAGDKNYGEGHNNSDGVKWANKESELREYTSGNYDDLSVYDVWGIVVTPAMANNQNFGCVLQCIGTTDAMMQPVIDCVEMNITYTQLGTTATTQENTSKDENIIVTTQSPYITSRIDKYYQTDTQEEQTNPMKTSLSLDYIYTGTSFYIRFINNVQTNGNGVQFIEDGLHDKITITLDKLRFRNGKTQMVIPPTKVQGSTDREDIRRGYISILKEITVYPTEEGTGIITIHGLHKTVKNETITTETIEITVRPSVLIAGNSLTTIKNSTFTNCQATKGTSIYNYGQLTYDNLTLNDITSTDNVLFDYDKYRDGEFR